MLISARKENYKCGIGEHRVRQGKHEIQEDTNQKT